MKKERKKNASKMELFRHNGGTPFRHYVENLQIVTLISINSSENDLFLKKIKRWTRSANQVNEHHRHGEMVKKPIPFGSRLLLLMRWQNKISSIKIIAIKIWPIRFRSVCLKKKTASMKSYRNYMDGGRPNRIRIFEYNPLGTMQWR